MHKIVTYNFKKSTSVGGIESLIRELQKLFIRSGWECTELYKEGSSADLYTELPGVVYAEVGGFNQGKITRLLATRSIIRRLKLKKNDVLFLFNPLCLLFVPLKVLVNSKVVLIQSSKFEVLLSSFLARLSMRLFQKFVYRYTVYTESDKDRLASLYPSIEDRIRVIQRGCRLSTAHDTRERSKKIVTIARIDHATKNFSAMVKVLERLPPSYSLDIYGGGSEADIAELRSIIKGHANICYLGPTNNVADVLRNYSIFIMTSTFEGFGQALIEARSQGLPVVAFNTFPNASWVVKDGETGFLIEPWDFEGFSGAIKYLASNENVYKKFSNASLLYAKETDINEVNLKWLLLVDGQ